MTDKLDILTSLALRTVVTNLLIAEDDLMIKKLKSRIEENEKILNHENNNKTSI